MKYEVAVLVCLPALDKGEVTSERFFKSVALAIEFSDLLLGAVRYYRLSLVAIAGRDLAGLKQSTRTCRREESGDARTTCSQLLAQVTLRGKVELKLTIKILLLKH